MSILINKLFILSCSLFIYFDSYSGDYMVVRIIAIVTLSALGSYFEKPVYKLLPVLIFALLSLFIPDLLFFAPVICYDAFMENYGLSAALLLLPLSVHYPLYSWEEMSFIIMLLAVSFVIKYYATDLKKIKNIYITLTDDARELSFALEQKNRELIEKQDYEVNLATLNERNRIAREIHDSVGHTMSSSILQVGALISTVTDEGTRKSLTTLKDTLSEGMDNIRNSVHRLYEDSIDLYAQLYSLTRDFTFCKLSLEYSADDSPPLKVKYAVISIVKEALANIIKHSNANSAELRFLENPGFYQLVISDNGSKKTPASSSGMGLNNIRSRIESMDGYLNIDQSNGFRIFISIPKGVKA